MEGDKEERKEEREGCVMIDGEEIEMVEEMV